MSGRGSGPRVPRRPGLSAEDADLWERASESYERARRLKPRVLPSESAGEDGGAAPPRSAAYATPAPARDLVARIPKPRAAPQPSPTKAAATIPPLAEFDRRKARKIAAGREDIDARIDLHGMRQSEAHAALRSFLLSCHGAGKRNVLVITGKGGPGAGGRADGEPLTFMDTRERGILKRNVPIWLAEPELRAIVVSYRSAAKGHGGDGALYIHLRARHKAGGR